MRDKEACSFVIPLLTLCGVRLPACSVCLCLIRQAQDRILLDHELKQMLDELLHSEAKLLEMYDDADGSVDRRPYRDAI